MNILTLILQAGPVAKVTMLVLVAISVGAWAVIWAKWRELSQAEKVLLELAEIIERSENCISLAKKLRRFRQMVGWHLTRTLLAELARFRAETGARCAWEEVEAFLRRLPRARTVSREREVLFLRRGLPLLAVAGNSSPFIGLFGTVWGIMSAFHDIGLKGTATLATVAPGIAEALIATALGLFAAIPAAMAYNLFTARLERVEVRLEEVGELVLLLIEKDLWREHATLTEDVSASHIIHERAL